VNILGIIPSRYASTRLPGKPLIDLAGKSMIQRVYEQCEKAQSLAEVVVATDDQRILDHVESFGGKAVMTSQLHETGTERSAEVMRNIGSNYDYAINIQGDEPFIHPSQIDTLANLLDGKNQLATLARVCDSEFHLFSNNSAKVTFNDSNEALYFSREPIPHLRNLDPKIWHEQGQHYIHIGIYGYEAEVLQELVKLPASQLEKSESLEQLRWLSNGYKIKVGFTDHPSYGIDSPEDVEPLLKMFNKA